MQQTSKLFHFDMLKAKLILWTKGIDVSEVEQAHTELLDKGFIAPCPDNYHIETCMVILR